MGTLWHDLARLEHEEKETQKKLSKTAYLIIFFFFGFYFSLSCTFCPQLGGMYASFSFLVYDWLNFNSSKDEIL